MPPDEEHLERIRLLKIRLDRTAKADMSDASLQEIAYAVLVDNVNIVREGLDCGWMTRQPMYRP